MVLNSANDIMQRCALLGRQRKRMGAEGDPENLKNRYRCCCRLMHVTTGAIIIAVLELLYLAYEIFSSFYLLNRTGDSYALSFSLSLFATLLAGIAVILLLVSVKTTTPYLLVPHMLMQVAVIFVLCIMCIFCLFAAVAGTSIDLTITNVERSPEGEQALNSINPKIVEKHVISRVLAVILIIGSILCLLLAILQVVLLRVVQCCYRYLQEKAFLKLQTSSRQTPLDGDSSLDENKLGDPLASLRNGTRNGSFNPIAISSTDVRDFTNPAETDC